MHNQFKLGFLICYFNDYKQFDEFQARDFIKSSKEEKKDIPLDILYFIQKQFPHLLDRKIVEETVETSKFNDDSYQIGLIDAKFKNDEYISESTAKIYLGLLDNLKSERYVNVNAFISENYPHLLEENTSKTIIRQPFNIEYIESNFNTYKKVTENEATMYLKDLKKYNQKGNEEILFFIKCNFPHI